MKKKRKEYNDKNYTQFGKIGWCLHEDIPCYGDCTECTLRHFPELEEEVEKQEYEKHERRRKNDRPQESEDL